MDFRQLFIIDTLVPITVYAMEKCFVIQPFDNAKFDQRYIDTFKPAIESAGLEPYRIDKDLSVSVPIDDIENGIANSAICFAEISSNNPNVWYELGYAFACGKEVIMVCSDEREGDFPFDIRHRQILTYRSTSKSDFENLESSITNKITAILQKSRKVKSLSATPVLDQQGLKAHEIAIIIIIAENQLTSEEWIGVYSLKEQMNRAGYTDIATSVGIKTLVQSGMVTTFMESDYNNNTYAVCALTGIGEAWLLSNQDKLVFRKEAPLETPNQQVEDDELPF